MYMDDLKTGPRKINPTEGEPQNLLFSLSRHTVLENYFHYKLYHPLFPISRTKKTQKYVSH